MNRWKLRKDRLRLHKLRRRVREVFLLQLGFTSTKYLLVILINLLVVIVWIELVLEVDFVLGLIVSFDLPFAQNFLDHCNFLLHFFLLCLLEPLCHLIASLQLILRFYQGRIVIRFIISFVAKLSDCFSKAAPIVDIILQQLFFKLIDCNFFLVEGSPS